MKPDQDPGTVFFAMPGVKMDLAVVGLATILINITGLALPLTLMQIYDRILVNHALNTLIWLIVGCVCAVAVETLVKSARAWITNWLGARFEFAAEYSALERTLLAPMLDFQAQAPSVHADRIRQAGKLKLHYSG